MSLPVASEKSGNDRSGIDGNETDGIAGMAGIMSRADFVMLSIRLGAASSAQAGWNKEITARPINKVFNRCAAPMLQSFLPSVGHPPQGRSLSEWERIHRFAADAE